VQVDTSKRLQLKFNLCFWQMFPVNFYDALGKLRQSGWRGGMLIQQQVGIKIKISPDLILQIIV
jgi:hypothetical protein